MFVIRAVWGPAPEPRFTSIILQDESVFPGGIAIAGTGDELLANPEVGRL